MGAAEHRVLEAAIILLENWLPQGADQDATLGPQGAKGESCKSSHKHAIDLPGRIVSWLSLPRVKVVKPELCQRNEQAGATEGKRY